MQLVTTTPEGGPATNDQVGGGDALAVHLNAAGHPRLLRLTLPTNVSPADEGKQWVLVRIPTQELLNRLARWSDPSFPNLRKLSSVLATVDAGGAIEAPVLVHHNVGHVFESGGHLALMLAQLGAPSVPVIVRTGTAPPRRRRRSIRAFLRRLFSDINQTRDG